MLRKMFGRKPVTFTIISLMKNSMVYELVKKFREDNYYRTPIRYHDP